MRRISATSKEEVSFKDADVQRAPPAKRVTIFYWQIDVEVDQQAVALARRHIQTLPVGTLDNVRRALVLSLDAAISGFEEIKSPSDVMDAFRIDLIFLRALDECLLDCEERLVGSGPGEPKAVASDSVSPTQPSCSGARKRSAST